VTTLKNRDTSSLVDLNDPVVEVDVSASKGIDVIHKSEASGSGETGESYQVTESENDIASALLAVDEGNAIETSFVLNGVNAANFTAEDEIGAKKVFAEAFDTTPDNIIFVSLHDYVAGEEATLAKTPKKNVEDVKSRAKEAVLRSRSIARHAAALGLAQTTPKLGASSSKSAPRKVLKEKTNDDNNRDYLNEYIKKVKAKKEASLNAAVTNRKSTANSFAIPTTLMKSSSLMKTSLTSNKKKDPSFSASMVGSPSSKPMATPKNLATSTVEEAMKSTDATAEAATKIRMVVLTEDVDAKELLIAERFSDPEIVAAVVARLKATGAPALAEDIGISLVEERKNKYDEYFSFLPESMRNAIHWVCNKIEFAFEGVRDWLLSTFGMSLTEADAITGAIIGGLIVIIVYLVLRTIYRRFVRYRLKEQRARSTGSYGRGNNDESRPLYRESSETITTKGGQTNREYSSSQQYGTTPPVSRGYYGAGAGPGRR
tara:strand:- start:4530 stop:5993 length:1464 start_codon:yes stop_codon:yes gene_type:complete